MKYKFSRDRADESSTVEIVEVSKSGSRHKRPASYHKRDNSSSHRKGSRSPRDESRYDRSSSYRRERGRSSPRKNASSPRRKSTRGDTTTSSPRKGGRSVSPNKRSSSSRHGQGATYHSQPLLVAGETTAIEGRFGRSNHPSTNQRYQPPHLLRVASSEESDTLSRDNEDKYSSTHERLQEARNDTFMNHVRQSDADRGGPFVIRPSGHNTLRNAIPEVSHSIDGTTDDDRTMDTEKDGRSYGAESESNRPLRSGQYARGRDVLAADTCDSDRFLDPHEDAVWSDDEFLIMKQRIAYLCIAVSAVQLGILLIQLLLCGVASVHVNPMIGPYPDAFSEWGGKNAYLMLEEHQYFRFITPAFLNVGFVHLLVNVFCQLETCAFFEREWGSARWLLFYVISTVGCVATSVVWNPDEIAVCSSGALMGLFGAKIAQVITWTAFDIRSSYFDSTQLDQLGGVMCSAALVSLLSFVTYIEWSGHMGGFSAGFFAGMFAFSSPIASRRIRLVWGLTGLAGLFIGAFYLGYEMIKLYPDEELGDACQYFRNLYPEGYNCECVWD